MPDMDPRQAEMDHLLWQFLAAPVPHLSPDFERAMTRELHRRSRPPLLFPRILLAGYGGVSAVVSVVVMRGHGLGWVAIAAMMLAPLATLEVARRTLRWQRGMTGK